jgi:hypothetical protein
VLVVTIDAVPDPEIFVLGTVLAVLPVCEVGTFDTGATVVVLVEGVVETGAVVDGANVVVVVVVDTEPGVTALLADE